MMAESMALEMQAVDEQVSSDVLSKNLLETGANEKLIAEEIRMVNVNDNYEQAIEHMPESFAGVVSITVHIILY